MTTNCIKVKPDSSILCAVSCIKDLKRALPKARERSGIDLAACKTNCLIILLSDSGAYKGGLVTPPPPYECPL